MRWWRRLGGEGNPQKQDEQRLDAVALRDLLGETVFDRVGAARFLGVREESIEMAVYRKRLPSVMYHRMRLFTRQDLIDYQKHRGTGRGSRLTKHQTYTILGRQVIVE